MKYFSFTNLLDILPNTGIDVTDCTINYLKIYTILYQGQRMIPEDSLVRFFQYHTVYFDVLYAHRDEGDEEMINIKNRLIELFDNTQNTWEEAYTRRQIADIFGVSIKEVNKAIRKENKFKIFLPKEITIINVLCYLKEHASVLDRLRDRHDMLLANGDLMESPVRHILMLYYYYRDNGYII